MNNLPACLLAIIWLWLDFTGLLLSVISTYFYFGWEGVPLLVVWIFLIALLAFSGPVTYHVLFRRGEPEKTLKGLLVAQALIYLAVTWVRESDAFAWLVVLGAWVSGTAMMAVFRAFHQFSMWNLPFYALLIGHFLYLSVRVTNFGLALLFNRPAWETGNYVPWLILMALLIGSLALPLRWRAQITEEPISNGQGPRFFSMVFGLLVGLGLGLIYNLNIWSAKTPQYQASAYFLSLALSSGLAVLAFHRLRQQLLPLLGVACVALGASLFFILYQSFDPVLGLLMHGAGCFGLAVLWQVFFYRYSSLIKENQGYFPVLGFQLGFVAFLMILAVFLLYSNPNGFWLALLLSGGLLIVQELKGQLPVLEQPAYSLGRLWLFSLACFSLPGLLSFSGLQAVTAFKPSPPPQKLAELTVVSSNIRYGWTDDYRFEPRPQLDFLKNIKADLMGFQEMNKGHTSGAYMDLYRYYQGGLPGDWRYGDANFGFGNALRSQFPIAKSEVRTYQAKDILRRSCLVSSIQLNGKTVDVYTTHLSHRPHPNPVRQAQMAELIGWLKAAQHPWILIGDFNATPDSPEVAELLKVSNPIFRQQPALLAEKSFSSLEPKERIDYIFFSSDFTLRRQEILDNHGTSDHKVVKSVLGLNF